MSSVKIYVQSAEIIRDFLNGKDSLQNLCYSQKTDNIKVLRALVYQTLKYRQVLIKVLCMSQVPGFRAHEIAKYEKLQARKNQDKTSQPKRKTNEDDDDENDMNLSSEALGISASWYSCQVNVNVPIKKAHDEGEAVNEKKKSKSLKVRYNREIMLVLAYEALFGSGLPFFSNAPMSKNEIQMGITAASKLLKMKPAIQYILNEDMSMLVNYIKNSGEERETLVKTYKFINFSKGLPTNEENNEDDEEELTPEQLEQKRLKQERIETNKNAIDEDDISNLLKQIRIKNAILEKNKLNKERKMEKKKEKLLKKNGGKKNELPAYLLKNTSTDIQVVSTEFPFACLPFVPHKDWTYLQRMQSSLSILKSYAIYEENKRLNPSLEPLNMIQTISSARIEANVSSSIRNQNLKEQESNELLLPITLRNTTTRKTPRYVRINTLKTTHENIHAQLKADSYRCLTGVPAQFHIRLPKQEDAPTDNISKYANEENYYLSYRVTDKHPYYPTQYQQQTISNEEEQLVEKKEKVYWIDPIIPDLLCFLPSDIGIISHPLVTESYELIIQDKASCFTPNALDPQPDTGDIIDSCSAPGNKTSYLAALVKNTGKIFAIELNTRRAERLKKTMQQVGATNTEVINTSFLSLDPLDPKYANVKYIMLDPSCSGSGNPSMDMLLATGGLTHSPDSVHVKSLSDLQTSLVSHAFKFPSVTKVVYSTCSVFERENEGVVTRLLDAAKEHEFQLCKVMPTWPCRGFKYIDIDTLKGDNVGPFVLDGKNLDEVTKDDKIHKFQVIKLHEHHKIITAIEMKKKNKLPSSTYFNPKLRFSVDRNVARVFPDLHHTGGFFVAGFTRDIKPPVQPEPVAVPETQKILKSTKRTLTQASASETKQATKSEVVIPMTNKPKKVVKKVKKSA